MEIPKCCKQGTPQPEHESPQPEHWSPGTVTRGGAWRAEVDARIGELEDRLAAVCNPPAGKGTIGCADPKSDAAAREAIEGRVRVELEKAVAAANDVQGCGWRSWWTGASITKGWEAVHNAELALLRIESAEAVSTAVPRLLGWTQRTMDAGKLREGHESALQEEIDRKEGTSPNRTKIREAMNDVISANSRRYAGVRTFRNNLIMTTLLLLALLVFIALWHHHHTHFLTLCASDVNGATKGCLGGTGPAPSDIGLVLLVGALGGLLGIAFGFTESEEAARYDPKTWQAFLKPVTGAATALAAVIFIQSHILVEITIHKKAEFLAYALLFGFSQQLLTKFVDKRAESLITPSK
jgi:hypothetical protein